MSIFMIISLILLKPGINEKVMPLINQYFFKEYND